MNINLGFVPILSIWSEYNLSRKVVTQLFQLSQIYSPQEKMRSYLQLQHDYLNTSSINGIYFQFIVTLLAFTFVIAPFSARTEEQEITVQNPNRYYYAAAVGAIVGLSCLFTLLFHRIALTSLVDYSSNLLLQIEVK
ncbi:MAG: hypothetical protein L0207_07065 [Chlamydiae bacterium]|nr:hypothetical protein [Chlamydiota bacterium]